MRISAAWGAQKVEMFCGLVRAFPRLGPPGSCLAVDSLSPSSISFTISCIFRAHQHCSNDLQIGWSRWASLLDE